jgi:hypothetical protein
VLHWCPTCSLELHPGQQGPYTNGGHTNAGGKFSTGPGGGGGEGDPSGTGDEGGDAEGSSKSGGVVAGVVVTLLVVLSAIGTWFVVKKRKDTTGEANAFQTELDRHNTMDMEENPMAAARKKKQQALNTAFTNPAFETGESSDTSEYLDVADSSFTGQPWYAAKLDKALCKLQVFGASTGDFLVRESQHQPGSYALCVNLGDGKVQEDLIKKDRTTGAYTIKFCKDQSFSDLGSLVQHCQTHSISPKRGITLKLGQPAGSMYGNTSAVAAAGVSVDDSIYECAYGEVDSGLLNFFNRVVAFEAEIYDALAKNPLGSFANLKAVTLSVALQTAATHCGSLDKALSQAKAFKKAKLIALFPKLTPSFIEIILMYTADSELYKMMNAAFGAYGKEKGRTMAVHYLPYAQLLISAVQCLPEVQMIVYRGVQMSHKVLLNGSTVGDTITWWPFVSTTGSPKVLRKKAFFDAVVRIDKVTGKVVGVENNSTTYDGDPTKVKHKTIFVIITLAGYHIVGFSIFDDEDEYLLLPGSTFLIEGILTWHNGITEVRLRQVASPYSLSAGGTGSSSSSAGGAMASGATDHLMYGAIDVYMVPDSNDDVYEPMGGGGGDGSGALYNASGNAGSHWAGGAVDMNGDALC